jgi:hypothetical protein
MQRFLLKILNREYLLVTCPNSCEKPEKNQIFLLPTDSEDFDFKINFCDTPPEIAKLICANFLFFYRGLPLSELKLLCNGKAENCEKFGPLVYTKVNFRKSLLKKTEILGCEIAYRDFENVRIVNNNSDKEWDGHIKSALLLASENNAHSLLILKNGEISVFPAENTLDFSDFSSLASFLFLQTLISESLNFNYLNTKFSVRIKDGVLQIGIFPPVFSQAK